MRTLPRNMGRLPREVWAPLANHSRLFNARGQKLQLAITAPLLQIVATEQGMGAVLSPAAAARGAHILPLAQDLSPVNTMLGNIGNALTGATGRALGLVALAAVGIAFLIGRMNWMLAISVIVGLAILFGAGTMLDGFS